MTVISSWLDFLTQAKALYIDRPHHTRYSLKYRHADAEITLKVTDDRKCLQFRSHLQSDLKYVDRINSAFIKLMTAKDPNTVSLTEELSEERKIEKRPVPSSSSSHRSNSTKGSKKPVKLKRNA